MTSSRIELFNNLLITCGQQPVATVNTNRLQSLLAYLVLHSDTPQSREQLAFLLWPESGESQGRAPICANCSTTCAEPCPRTAAS